MAAPREFKIFNWMQTNKQKGFLSLLLKIAFIGRCFRLLSRFITLMSHVVLYEWL